MATKEFTVNGATKERNKVTWTTITRIKRLPSLYDGKSISVDAIVNGSPVLVNNHFLYFNARDASEKNGAQVVKVDVQRANLSGATFEVAKNLATNGRMRIFGMVKTPESRYGSPVIECTAMASINDVVDPSFGYKSMMRRQSASRLHKEIIFW